MTLITCGELGSGGDAAGAGSGSKAVLISAAAAQMRPMRNALISVPPRHSVGRRCGPYAAAYVCRGGGAGKEGLAQTFSLIVAAPKCLRSDGRGSTGKR